MHIKTSLADNQQGMVELLAPARDVNIGITAINSGADAVYIGAPQFSARSAAGNSVQDIEKLCNYAHLFGCKVLIALNTILTNDEIPTANRMVWDVYNAGADALIMQDFGLLETNLPPIRLHASTQCNNVSIEHINWLEQVGFSRVVLARELSIDDIRAIRSATTIELEAFVHGALCVSYSGQCYMSAALRNRSANRGECAQMCRLPYDLLDANGKEIIHQKYLLSLCDMDRSAYLNQLIEAGITTLKIEGRLKDEKYVKNIVTYYSQLLGKKCNNDFAADPQKTFHRSQTDYFLHGRTRPLANFETPKSTGEEIGRVIKVSNNQIVVSTNEIISQGDGICISTEGFYVKNVSKTNGNTTLSWDIQHTTIDTSHIKPGMIVYRNFDRVYIDRLIHYQPQRKRLVDITFRDIDNAFTLAMQSDTIRVEQSFTYTKELATNPIKAKQTIHNQLCKLGGTIFEVNNIDVQLSQPYFLPISVLNEWRRQVCAELEQQCLHSYERINQRPLVHAPYYSTEPLDYHANIHNDHSASFYRSCGAEIAERSFESNPSTDDNKVELMRCRYCLKYEMGWCKKRQTINTNAPLEPLYIRQGEQLLQLHFDCKHCQMIITKK